MTTNNLNLPNPLIDVDERLLPEECRKKIASLIALGHRREHMHIGRNFSVHIDSELCTLYPIDELEAIEDHEELMRLEKTWSAVSYEANGMLFHVDQDEEPNYAQLTLNCNNYQRRDQGAYRIDHRKTPKEIDFMPTKGQFQGLTLLGIYSLEGETLKICESVPSKQARPTEFKTSPGSGTVLFTYQLVKH